MAELMAAAAAGAAVINDFCLSMTDTNRCQRSSNNHLKLHAAKLTATCLKTSLHQKGTLAKRRRNRTPCCHSFLESCGARGKLPVHAHPQAATARSNNFTAQQETLRGHCEHLLASFEHSQTLVSHVGGGGNADVVGPVQSAVLEPLRSGGKLVEPLPVDQRTAKGLLLVHADAIDKATRTSDGFSCALGSLQPIVAIKPEDMAACIRCATKQIVASDRQRPHVRAQG